MWLAGFAILVDFAETASNDDDPETKAHSDPVARTVFLQGPPKPSNGLRPPSGGPYSWAELSSTHLLNTARAEATDKIRRKSRDPRSGWADAAQAEGFSSGTVWICVLSSARSYLRRLRGGRWRSTRGASKRIESGASSKCRLRLSEVELRETYEGSVANISACLPRVGRGALEWSGPRGSRDRGSSGRMC